MTTKLQLINDAVAEHEQFKKDYENGKLYYMAEFREPYATLLRDLLPTLELMVAWESMESRDMPMSEQTKLYDKLNSAIAALVKETEVIK